MRKNELPCATNKSTYLSSLTAVPSRGNVTTAALPESGHVRMYVRLQKCFHSDLKHATCC